ncbi:hypothetical protein DPMN_147587 [Dreissena polymorpha]|uniref:Uncharacterized protein n=1 Tax=Dreissena polymorpha TaxID=45954 RepID=A0A9D4FDZ2_DREPO|nr:hypothetical protein DPMN_147587 [Dreissena polymorpha]
MSTEKNTHTFQTTWCPTVSTPHNPVVVWHHAVRTASMAVKILAKSGYRHL